MATKETPKYLDKESDVSATCSPCLEAKRTIEAICYCVDCKSYVCDQCLQDHNKFATLRKHHIVDKSEAVKHLQESDQSMGDIRVECGSHYGQYVDSYCKHHEEVCCSVCVTVKHRSCEQTESILNVAKGIKKRKEFSDTKLSLEYFLAFANQEKLDRKENLTRLDEEVTQILTDIDIYEKNMIERIRQIAEISRQDVGVTYAKHVHAVKSDIRELDTVMSGLKESSNKLDRIETNDLEAFVSMKNCQKTLGEVKQVVNDLSDKWLQTELHYRFNDAIIEKETMVFGDIIEESKRDQLYRLKCKRASNIKNKTDERSCEIKGICQLADGTFVIIDSNNTILTRLAENLDVIDHLDLKESPNHMCVTGPTEIAITLPENNLIQFVNVDERLSLGPSFSTAPTICTVINYDSREDKIYACSKDTKRTKTRRTVTAYNGESFKSKPVYKTIDTISVFNKNGKKLLSHEYDSIFSRQPNQIFLAAETITITDENWNIVTFKKTAEGKLELSCSPWPLNRDEQRCLCLLPKDIMLVGFKASGEMSLFSTDRMRIKNLKMENPQQVLKAVFNKQRSTLIVVVGSSEIREYKMPMKILLLLK